MTVKVTEHPETWVGNTLVNYIMLIKDRELAESVSRQLHTMHLIQDAFGPVKYNTEKLGPPKWEWERYENVWESIWEGKNWRVYAGEEGTAVELRAGLTEMEVLEAWADYLEKLAGIGAAESV